MLLDSAGAGHLRRPKRHSKLHAGRGRQRGRPTGWPTAGALASRRCRRLGRLSEPAIRGRVARSGDVERARDGRAAVRGDRRCHRAVPGARGRSRIRTDPLRAPPRSGCGVSRTRGRDTSVPLASLADEEFLFFPRVGATTLRPPGRPLPPGGIEPKLRNGSFHTGWDMRLVTATPVVAIAPASVSRDLPEGFTALDLSDVTDRIETAVVWHAELSPSPTLRAFGVVRAVGHRTMVADCYRSVIWCPDGALANCNRKRPPLARADRRLRRDGSWRASTCSS